VLSSRKGKRERQGEKTREPTQAVVFEFCERGDPEY
jgi:hypothetical protein